MKNFLKESISISIICGVSVGLLITQIGKEVGWSNPITLKAIAIAVLTMCGIVLKF